MVIFTIFVKKPIEVFGICDTPITIKRQIGVPLSENYNVLNRFRSLWGIQDQSINIWCIRNSYLMNKYQTEFDKKESKICNKLKVGQSVTVLDIQGNKTTYIKSKHGIEVRKLIAEK